jgi:molybdenum cofactor cytidylyltransferase
MKKIAAVVLAAGSSSRMGAPKQLLPYHDTTLLNHTLLPVATLFPGNTYLVLGANASAVLASIPEGTCHIVINHEWATGMATSVQAGLQRSELDNPDLDGIIFLTADQPAVTASHLAKMLAAYLSGHYPIIASKYEGVAGVPALFDKRMFPELKKLIADTGARHIIRQFENEVLPIPLADGGIDIDTPAQYQHLINKK